MSLLLLFHAVSSLPVPGASAIGATARLTYSSADAELAMSGGSASLDFGCATVDVGLVEVALA